MAKAKRRTRSGAEARVRWTPGDRPTNRQAVRAFCRAEFVRRFGIMWGPAVVRVLTRDAELDVLRRKVLLAHRALVKASTRAAELVAKLEAELSEDDGAAVLLPDLASHVDELRRLGLIEWKKKASRGRGASAKPRNRGRIASSVQMHFKHACTPRDMAIVSLLLGNWPESADPKASRIEILAREADAMKKAAMRAARHFT